MRMRVRESVWGGAGGSSGCVGMGVCVGVCEHA